MTRLSFFSILILSVVLMFGCAKEGRHVAHGARSEPPYFLVVRSNLKALDGKQTEALEDLQKAIAIYPEDVYLKYLAAQRYAEMKNMAKGMEMVDWAIRKKPDWVLPKILKGRLLEESGNFAEAAKIFEEVIKLDKDNEVGYFKLAQNLVNQKKFQPAISLLNKWLVKNPDSVMTLFYIATIQNFYIKSPQSALATYQKILKLDPENLKVRQEMAQIYLNLKNNSKALQELIEIEKRAPADIGIKLRIASMYQEAGQIDSAIQTLQSILLINPKADRIHYFLALIYEQKRMDEEALYHFQNIPPTSGLYRDAVFHQAVLLRESKRFDEAIGVLKRGIQKNPDVSPFYQVLAQIHEDLGHAEEAVSDLKKGLKKIPKDEQLHFNLAVLYDKKKDRVQSIREMRIVMEINPNNPSALNYVGYLLAEKGENLEEAERLIKKALEIKPDDAYIIDSLGWVYFQKGDLDKAHQYLNKAYRLIPSEPTITEHLGDLFLKQGKKREALKYFEKALLSHKKKEKPDQEEIRRVEKKIQDLKI